MSKVRIIAIVIASCGMMAAAIMLLKTVNEYRRAEMEYDELEQFISSSNADQDSDNAKNSTLPGNGLLAGMTSATDGEVLEEKERILTRNYNREDFPDISVDFKGLSSRNSELVAWLYVEGAQINYPVVQGADNEYYLHHTFEKKENSSGCVFMDWEVDPNLTSWNTFIYGHNMKNGSMFGHLKNYINNSKTYENSPYIFIFRPEGIYRYEIFSYYFD